MESVEKCWICGSTEIVYTDVIGCHWCQKDWDEIYLETPPDQSAH